MAAVDRKVQDELPKGGEEALKHVLYEIRQFAWAYEKLGAEREKQLQLGNKSYDVCERNALLESFLLHTRCLLDFLAKEKRPSRGPDDMLPSDFGAAADASLAKEAKWEKDWYQAINKEIAHLTLSRTSDMHKKRWPTSKIFKELVDPLRTFLSAAQNKLPKCRDECISVSSQLTKLATGPDLEMDHTDARSNSGDLTV